VDCSVGILEVPVHKYCDWCRGLRVQIPLIGGMLVLFCNPVILPVVVQMVWNQNSCENWRRMYVSWRTL